MQAHASPSPETTAAGRNDANPSPLPPCASNRFVHLGDVSDLGRWNFIRNDNSHGQTQFLLLLFLLLLCLRFLELTFCHLFIAARCHLGKINFITGLRPVYLSWFIRLSIYLSAYLSCHCLSIYLAIVCLSILIHHPFLWTIFDHRYHSDVHHSSFTAQRPMF